MNRLHFSFMKRGEPPYNDFFNFLSFDFLWLMFRWFKECGEWWLSFTWVTKKYIRYFQFSSTGCWGDKIERGYEVIIELDEDTKCKNF